jgi:hypothetical protein
VALITWLRHESRKVGETRAEGRRAKLWGLGGCNPAMAGRLYNEIYFPFSEIKDRK